MRNFKLLIICCFVVFASINLISAQKVGQWEVATLSIKSKKTPPSQGKYIKGRKDDRITAPFGVAILKFDD